MSSNPATLPAAAIVTLLAAGGLGLTAGTNLFACAELPPDAIVPHKAVFVAEYGGPAPVPYLGIGQDLRSMAVQVLVRGDPEDMDGARTLAWALFPVLQHATPSGYVDVRCNQSTPTYLGRDNTEHHRYSINLTLRFKG